MSSMELIKELRALTQAGMKDCKDAIAEADGDLQKAVDIIKAKGLNIASGREGKTASEGRVLIMEGTNFYDKDGKCLPDKELAVMIEVNCQTDFVANSPDFISFVESAGATLNFHAFNNEHFTADIMENSRKEVVAKTKENIVVRRWWVEEAMDPKAKVFSYTHSNNKIGVLLTLLAPSEDAAKDPAFRELGENLAMQIAAMSPLAVSAERLDPAEVDRQKKIFETQLTELNRPQAAWAKILEGKFNKWYTEVCLLNQESVVQQKTSVAQVIKDVGAKLGGEIQVVNFIRCQVGEGLEKAKENLADEVEKLSGVKFLPRHEGNED